MSDETVDVLLYSDDVDTRKAVRGAVGLRPGKDAPKVHWVEAATGWGALNLVKQGDFGALVLDGEAAKIGGMAVAREITEDYEVESVPPIIMLTARPQDDWLATYSGARATVPEPLDALQLQQTLARALRGEL